MSEKIDRALGKLEKLTEEMVADLTGKEPEGPYLHVRVAVRTPGGMEASFDYDAVDAADGQAALTLVGVHLDPQRDVEAGEARRLEKLLRVALGTYNLSVSDEWAAATRTPAPETKGDD